MDAPIILTGDLKKMSGNEENVQMCACISRDVYDRQSLCVATKLRNDPIDLVTHVTGSLLDISSGLSSNATIFQR